MKKFFFAILALTQLATFAPSFAQEGKASGGDEEFQAFCDRTLKILERSRDQAGEQSRRGNFSGAVNSLIAGLSSAGRTYGDQNPVTLNLIAHAHDMGTLLRQESAANIKGIKATAIALESFYDLIFDTAAKIDYQFYRCHNSRRGCRYSRTLQFENNMLSMVKDMLTLVNSNLLVTRGSQIFPLGPSSSFLVASESVTAAAYNELKDLVYGAAYACEILDLKDLADDLALFNSIPQSERVKQQKVYQVSSDMDSVINDLGNGRCRH